MDNYGEKEGKNLIRKAIWKFGSYRVKKIRENVLRENLELNLVNLVKYYDMAVSKLKDSEIEVSTKFI